MVRVNYIPIDVDSKKYSFFYNTWGELYTFAWFPFSGYTSFFAVVVVC